MQKITNYLSTLIPSVLAFDKGGLKDIILLLQTVDLAKFFGTQELANGIKWSFEQYKNNYINIQSINEVIGSLISKSQLYSKKKYKKINFK